MNAGAGWGWGFGVGVWGGTETTAQLDIGTPERWKLEAGGLLGLLYLHFQLTELELEIQSKARPSTSALRLLNSTWILTVLSLRANTTLLATSH